VAIFRRIANLFHRSHIDREIRAEFEAHMAMREEDNMSAGMSREDAHRNARLRFGNPASTRETVVSADAALHLASVWADTRHALRQLCRAPGFAVIAILTLALGIGANTAVFSVADRVLVRPVAYPRPDRIVQFEKTDGAYESYSASIPLFLAWKQRNQAFERIAAYSVLPVGFNLAQQGRPERVTGLRVSADFFRVLGVEPQLGRNFKPEDDREGAERQVLLSDTLWHRHYNNDPGIIGKQISIDGEPAIVAGVLPRGFQFLAIQATSSAIEVWTPLRLPAASHDPSGILECIGRLNDGVTSDQAVAQMTALSRQFQHELPAAFPPGGSVRLLPLRQRLGEDVRSTLLLLLSATGLLLLIACVNVANLLSARMADRAPEIALRAALGATRMRILRQLMAESLLLALAGGATGICLVWVGVRVLLRLAPLSISRFNITPLDGRVLFFAFGISLITGVLFGVSPGWRMSGVPAGNALHRRTTAGRSQRAFSGALTIAETALSLVLLVTAGLLLESFMKLQQVDAGFNYRRLLTFETTLPAPKYSDPAALERFLNQTRQSLSILPHVTAVAAVSSLPTEPTLNAPFTLDGDQTPAAAKAAANDGDELIVTPGYLESMQIPLLEGRTFTQADQAHSTPVILINKTLARKLFPAGSPIGKRIQIGKNLGPAWVDSPREIIGVVGDVRAVLEDRASPSLYVPFAQVRRPLAMILLSVLPVRWAVRTDSGVGVSLDDLDKAVHEQDSSIALADVRPMEALLSQALERWRFNMVLLGAFAAIALALAGIGIFGVVSYSVAQRTQEIGIRMALGARRSAVLGLILQRSMVLVCAGTAIGVCGALLGARLLRSLLYGVTPNDPTILTAVSILLVIVGFIACWLPGRRASAIDPIKALRSE
jgi:putative ABC transport system permease protein